MTFKNISENSVINAGGRLLDPGTKIPLKVEYYDKYKDFIDAYVTKGDGEIDGIKEYNDFIKNGKTEVKKEKKIDLMEEVREEETAKEPEVKAAPEPKIEAKEELQVEEKKELEVEEKEIPKKKATPRRRRTTKKTDEA